MAELSRLLLRSKRPFLLSSNSNSTSLLSAKGMQPEAVLGGREYACTYIVTTDQYMSLRQAVLSFQQENMEVSSVFHLVIKVPVFLRTNVQNQRCRI